MEICKWKWMVLSALECMNIADLEIEEKNDNFLLDVRLIASNVKGLQF